MIQGNLDELLFAMSEIKFAHIAPVYFAAIYSVIVIIPISPCICYSETTLFQGQFFL